MEEGALYQTGLKSNSVSSEITDLNGRAELTAIKPGRYYVILGTPLGSDAGCAWCVPVIIKPGRNKIILRNENVNEDLFHEGESQITSPSPESSTSFTPSPSISNLTYESERDAVLTRHRNKQITNEAAIQELKALKVKYRK